MECINISKDHENKYWTDILSSFYDSRCNIWDIFWQIANVGESIMECYGRERQTYPSE